MRFFILLIATVINALPSSNGDKTSLLNVMDDHIYLETSEDVYGIQFNHNDCKITQTTDHPFKFHKSGSVVLAYSDVLKPIGSGKMFEVDATNCNIDGLILAGEKGRKLEAKIVDKRRRR